MGGGEVVIAVELAATRTLLVVDTTTGSTTAGTVGLELPARQQRTASPNQVAGGNAFAANRVIFAGLVAEAVADAEHQIAAIERYARQPRLRVRTLAIGLGVEHVSGCPWVPCAAASVRATAVASLPVRCVELRLEDRCGREGLGGRIKGVDRHRQIASRLGRLPEQVSPT